MTHRPPFIIIGILVFGIVLSVRAVVEAAPRIISVSTADGLQAALAAPQEGDIIELADGVYPVGDLTGAYGFFLIADPGVQFTIKAVNAGAAVLDGEGVGRIFEYQVNTPGEEGWVTFEGLAFENGRTTTFDAGALMMRGGKATFLDCVFRNNRAEPDTTTGASAGAVFITNEAVVQFFSCTFENNVSDNHGGAMILGQGSKVYLFDSRIENNVNNLPGHRRNGLGGAIHLFNSLEGATTELLVANTRFFGNAAGFSGGAIMAKGNFSSSAQPTPSPTLVVVSNSTFEDNIALNDPSVTPASPTEGGAIMAENNVVLQVYNSRFFANSAGLGGAISSYRADVTVGASVFRNNAAFGRVDTTSGGQGGAIKCHSNDSCADEQNYQTGSLSVTDSFFDTNQAQFGGSVFAAGDSIRSFSTVTGCQLGTLADNRMPVALDRVTIVNSSVDDLIGNHALGGGVYGYLIDLVMNDSMILDSTASGTDPSDAASSSQGQGGGATIRVGSRVSITGTIFEGNSADHEGGGLHLLGTEIVDFSGNEFVGNEVSPGGNRPETSSEGAAIYVAPATVNGLDVSGAIRDSVFTDNIGLPIFDSDTTDSNSCGCFNLVTYDGNTFYNTTYGDSVYRDSLVAGTLTAAELNTVVVDHFGGTLTKKSLDETNLDEVSPITAGRVQAAPETVIGAAAAGDSATSTDSFLTWAWNGGCAELDGANLASGTGFLSVTAAGTHQLDVWAGGVCSGTPDISKTVEIFSVDPPAVEFAASPIAVESGESSTLSWALSGGVLVSGMISHEALPIMTDPAGTTVVAPLVSTGYHLGVVTERGGATADVRVYVDEDPPEVLFVDGFESGTVGAWSSAAGT